MVKRILLSILLPLFLLLGCGENTAYKSTTIGSFIDVLKQNGVEGTVEVEIRGDSEDIDYIATYVISAFTSTRILSFFNCRDEASAIRNLNDAMKNSQAQRPGQKRDNHLRGNLLSSR